MKKKRPIVILSFDPGVKNMGWCITEVRRKNYRILQCGMLRHTVSDLKGKQGQQMADMILEINKILRHNLLKIGGLRKVVAERFMARGMRQTTGELISTMLGALILLFITPGLELVTASTWKNQANRHLPMLMKKVKKRNGWKKLEKPIEAVYEVAQIEPHIVDAALIGIYVFNKKYNRNPFENLTLKSKLRKFLLHLENRRRK